jgi:hypothetical protein
METREHIKKLRENAERLLQTGEFEGLAVISIAIAIEKQIKNIVIYNYRKAGLSASFVRGRLVKRKGYADLLHELEWAACFNGKKKLKQIWKEAKTPVLNLYGIMETRNLIVHSVRSVPLDKIESNVQDLLLVLEKLTEIFESNFGYNGFDALPKSIKKKELNVRKELLHVALVNEYN